MSTRKACSVEAKELLLEACSICSQLRDVETSFCKFAAPDYDRPLPQAATRLAVVVTPDTDDPERYHVRCCPECGALYHYRFSHEYHMNGSEDEEELTRMTPHEAAAYLRSQAWALEVVRQDIDTLESGAGRLADYLDRGHPSPSEAEAALTAMNSATRDAGQLREQLQTQVTALRQSCTGILTTWAAAHGRVCDYYAAHPTGSDQDAETVHYVAQTALAAWKQLPYSGETFVSVTDVWMEGYEERLNAELAR